MVESVQAIYDTIYKELKVYITDNSKYSPTVVKKEPNDKLFPLVVIKELSKNSKYTTLKYTDDIYYMDLEINVYAIQNKKTSNMTIANEITLLIEQYFKETYHVTVKITYDMANIDTNVFRNLISVSFKVETKYKDKLVISPK